VFYYVQTAIESDTQGKSKMIINLHFITGFCIGFEYVPSFDDESHFVIDLGVIRILFSTPHDD
jgi:hypothetical protein